MDLQRVLYWLSAGLATGVLVLAVAAVWLGDGNAKLQQAFNARQAMVQQSQQIEGPLYRELVATLAGFVAKGDSQIAELLTTQGVKVSLARKTEPQPAPVNEAEKADTSKAKP
jgi:hypothetical protein